MKKNTLVFGLISGLIASSMLIATAIKCYQEKDFEGNMILGFTIMIIAFAFIFVGIKNYRDQFNNGLISFWKAFKVGLFIAFVASSIYVLVWLIAYYAFIPDFMEKYTAHEIAAAKNLPAVEMQKKVADMNFYTEMYKNPIYVVLLTYMEIFPVGLIITLLSALILKRKERDVEVA